MTGHVSMSACREKVDLLSKLQHLLTNQMDLSGIPIRNCVNGMHYNDVERSDA